MVWEPKRPESQCCGPSLSQTVASHESVSFVDGKAAARRGLRSLSPRAYRERQVVLGPREPGKRVEEFMQPPTIIHSYDEISACAKHSSHFPNRSIERAYPRQDAKSNNELERAVWKGQMANVSFAGS